MSRASTPIPLFTMGTSTRHEIVSPPRDQGRHARFGMLTHPDGSSQWYPSTRDPGEHVGSHRVHLAQLGELLAALAVLADDDGAELHWTITTQLGAAGSVTFNVDVHPHRLSVAERDSILAFAARLANWDHR